MSSKEPLPTKDFYFDMGTKDGLREGDILTVYRVLPVMNGFSGVPELSMRVPLGEVKVLTAGERVSVGKQETANAELPALESQGFMMGDLVQLKSSLPFH